MKRAIEFKQRPRTSLRWGTRIRGKWLEEVRYDDASELFTVFKLEGPNAGATKTFYIPEGSASEKLKYFRDQGKPFIDSGNVWP